MPLNQLIRSDNSRLQAFVPNMDYIVLPWFGEMVRRKY